MPDTYSWSASVTGGLWEAAANWTDTTTKAAATAPPGAANAATITGGAGTDFQIVTGPGSAASLQFYGNTALEGSFTATSLAIGGTIAALSAGAVDLETQATLATGGPASLIGDLELDGTGAVFATPLLIESPGASLYDLDGATMLANAATIAGFLYVDPLGIAGIGTVGGAGAGSLTVEAGATLTLATGAEIDGTIALAGTLLATGEPFVEGDVTGAGVIGVAGTSVLDVLGSITGASLLTLGSLANMSAYGLANIGTVAIGTGASLSVSGDITGGGAIEIGTSAALSVAGTLSGLGRIDITGGTLALSNEEGTLAPQDVNVPIDLAGAAALLLDAGSSIGGAVAGFAVGDLITVLGDAYNPSQLVTGAALAAGVLTLSDDGTITNTISLAGLAAGAQFLTNAVGLPEGLPTGTPFGSFGATDIVLASGTTTGLGGTGAVTVTGALGTSFQVLAGAGTATGLTFIDNIALEGSFSAAQITVAAGDSLTTNALDLQAGATLAATANATISSAAEIDGAGARLTVAGTLTLAGGELLAVNGGTVTARALALTGTAGGATIAADAAGAIEIGTLADAQTGAILIDAGASLPSLGTGAIIGALVDQGTLALANAGFDISFLTVDGTISGGGVVNLGTSDTLEVNGDVTGVALAGGASANIDITGTLRSAGVLTLGSLGVLSVGSAVTGLAGLTIGAEGNVTVGGTMSGVGPVNLGSAAVATIAGAVTGSGLLSLGTLAQASIGGTLSGFSQVTLAGGATLDLAGNDTVPITLGGTGDVLGLNPLLTSRDVAITGVTITGVTIAGTVTGFAIGDAITADTLLYGSGQVITGASLAGGILTLTADGTVADLIAMAGNAGQQFLTNAVGVPDLAATDIVLPSATLSAIGTGNTITGATGMAFDVLTGTGTAATLNFAGNLALEGSYAATGTTIVTTGSLAGAVLDIEAAATLTAAGALIEGAMEVDGTGAAMLAAGTLSLGGGAGTPQLLAANGGRVQAAALVLAGSNAVGASVLAVDPAGRIEIGTAGLGAAGTITIDAGRTLTALGGNGSIQGPVADNGVVLIGTAAAALAFSGSLTGTGTLAIGDHASAQLQDVAGLTAITAGATAELTVSGDMAGIGTLAGAAGAIIDVFGSVTGAAGITIGTSAALSIAGDLSGTGTLVIGAGASASILGTVSGLGEIVLGAGAELTLGDGDAGVPILMGANSTLVIDPFTTITGQIEGFASGDAIAVTGAVSTIVTEADLVQGAGGNALLLSDDGVRVASLPVAGSFGVQQFLTNVADAATGEGQTDITLATPCFAAGTGIATARGRVRVEALRVGDMLPVASIGMREIVWIGHRRVDCRRHRRPEAVWPVRIAAGAFAAGQPGKTMFLSPDHAVFADGVLIPVRCLVNGRTIRQVPRATIEYFHVELSLHDVIWAEGLAVETYLDTGNRMAFANGGAAMRLHPDFSPLSWNDACAELVQHGPRVVALRERLFARAGAVPERSFELSVTAEGCALAPTCLTPGIMRFDLPDHTRSLRLMSPSWMPAAQSPASLDRRSLGVRLFAIILDGRPAGLDDPMWFSGFHAIERTAEGSCRWTDGDARLVLPAGAREITLHVGDEASSSFLKKRTKKLSK